MPAGSKAELVLTAPDGTESRQTIFDFKGDGIALGMHNTEESICSFARSCFNYALDQGEDLWFGTKVQFPRRTTIASKISLQKFLRRNIRTVLKRLALRTSIR